MSAYTICSTTSSFVDSLVESQMYVLKAGEFVQEITDIVSNTVTLTACTLFDTHSKHCSNWTEPGQFLKVTVCSNKAQCSATPETAVQG